MRKIFLIVFTILLWFFLSLGSVPAASPTPPPTPNPGITVTQIPTPAYVNTDKITLRFTSDTPNTFLTDKEYSIVIWDLGADLNSNKVVAIVIATATNNSLVFTLNLSGHPSLPKVGTWHYKVYLGKVYVSSSGGVIVDPNAIVYVGSYNIYPPSGPGGTGLPALEMDFNVYQTYNTVPLYIRNAQPDQDYTVWLDDEESVQFADRFDSTRIGTDIHGHPQTVTTQINTGRVGQKKVCLTHGRPIAGFNISKGLSCDFSVQIGVQTIPPPRPSITPTPILSNQPGVPLLSAPPPVPKGTPYQPDCEPVDQNDPTKGYKSCQTAIGQIPTDPGGLVSFLLRLILGLSGGIALLLIIFSGYRMATAAGNPEALQGARETLTSAMVGLVFIILSLVILQVIGVDILGIPGFGS